MRKFRGRGYERLDRAGQIGQGFGNGNQLATLTLHALFSHVPQTKTGTPPETSAGTPYRLINSYLSYVVTSNRIPTTVGAFSVIMHLTNYGEKHHNI